MKPSAVALPGRVPPNTARAPAALGLLPILLGLFLPLSVPHAAPASLTTGLAATHLEQPTVQARGVHTRRLEVTRFGRYAITVRSDQGVGLQWVDKMKGPSPMVGSPGQEDGRIDTFLDHGTYLLRTFGAPHATGEATLQVHPFTERNAAPPRQLVALKPIHSSLEDFEQRSWWLQLTKARTIDLEAAGRNLADLRLWADGEWMVDAAPTVEILEPKSGQPLRACRLSVRLEPGIYLVTAYGGPALPWAEAGPTHPLHLRYGVPLLPAAGRARHQVSPFGIDRYRVPKGVDFVRLELESPAPAQLRLEAYQEDDPYAPGRKHKNLTKKTNPPVAELTGALGDGLQTITVTGEAGLPYVLQHFKRIRSPHTLPSNAGPHYVATLQGGDMDDLIDATALITRRERRSARSARPHTVKAADVLDLSAIDGYRRRFNLLSKATLLLYTADEGDYRLEFGGVEAQVRIEPFLVTKPRGYKAPPLRGSGSVWSLTPGYHVLSLVPKSKGILELAIRDVGLMSRLTELVWDSEDTRTAPHGNPEFSPVLLDSAEQHLRFNTQPGTAVGLILRSLPLDLTEPLPRTQRPGQMLELPFIVQEAGRLTATTEDGSQLELQVDGGPWRRVWTLDASPEEHRVAVRHTGPETVAYVLHLASSRLDPSTPLPPLSDGALSARPRLPLLTGEAPQFLDLDRHSRATYNLLVSKPGLYQLESTGLLATEGNLRSRTIPSFLRARDNGVGRNFLIQNYLTTGDYQLTVQALGNSTGHLGLRLEQTPTHDGGALIADVPARIALEAGAAVRYTFTIHERGTYRLRSLGMGRIFRCRLEDGDGWPILPPGGSADITRTFEPGAYRLVLLPEATPSRRVTLLEPQRVPLTYEGHGPHPLPLGLHVQHTWMEPEEGASRRPDVWRVYIPAPIDVAIDLDNEMQADIVRTPKDGPEVTVGFVPPARGWRGPLEPGWYQIRATCFRPNNRVRYGLSVTAQQLVVGAERRIQVPATVPVSVGKAQLIALASFGATDVRARLYRGEALLGSSDDRTADWNFYLAQRLSPGRYTLQVEAVGSGPRQTTLTMRAPRETVAPLASLPLSTTLQARRRIDVLPLSIASRHGLLMAAAQAQEPVGLSLEHAEGGGWRTLASDEGYAPHVAVPLGAESPGDATYRLRVWALDGRGNPVKVWARQVQPPRQRERGLRNGIPFRTPKGLPGVGAIALKLSGPGVLQLQAPIEGLRACARPDAPCQAVTSRWLRAETDRLWLTVPMPKGEAPTLVARRLELRATSEEQIQLEVPTQGTTRVDVHASSKAPMIALARATAGLVGVQLEDGTERPALRTWIRGPWTTGTPNANPRATEGSVSDPGATGAKATKAPTGTTGTSAGVELPRAALHRWGVGAQSSVSILLKPSRDTHLQLWRATDAGEQMEARLRLFQQPIPPVTPIPWGIAAGEVPAGAARALSLPSGAKRMTLVLGDEVVAAVTSGGQLESVHWRDGTPFEVTVMTGGDGLLLFNLGSEASPYRLRSFRRASPDAAEAAAVRLSPEHQRGQERLERNPRLAEAAAVRLSPEHPYAVVHPVAGTLRIPLTGVSQTTRGSPPFLRGAGGGSPLKSSGFKDVEAPPSPHTGPNGDTLSRVAGGGSPSASKGCTDAESPPPGHPGPMSDSAPKGSRMNSPSKTIHLGANSLEAQLVTADGRVARGSNLPWPTSRGVLTLTHGPGLALAWVDGPGEPRSGLWGDDALDTDTTSAAPPVETALPFLGSLHGAVQTFAIRPEAAGLLQLRTSAPVVVRLTPQAGPPRVHLLETGGTLALPVALGRHLLAFRPLGSPRLSGALELTWTRATPIGEGLGPEVLLGAGETQLFRFVTTRAGPIGLGVLADREVVTCVLLDERGTPLGEGLVQMPTLEPGHYLLALHAPADAALVAPIRARPALAGLEIPDSGPPAAVIQTYLKMAEVTR